jgi:hypothetical protein
MLIAQGNFFDINQIIGNCYNQIVQLQGIHKNEDSQSCDEVRALASGNSR